MKKNKDTHFVYEHLLLLAKQITPSTPIFEIQSQIKSNPHVLAWLQGFNEKNNISPSVDPIHKALQHLHSELIKFLNSKESANLKHQFDCLIVPFERFLQKKMTDADFIISENDKNTKRDIYPLRLILENLRSEFNVGSIFRSAECFGVEFISLCGYTPIPQKTDMGTKESIPYELQTTDEAISLAKQNNFTVIALETIQNGQKLHQISLSEKVCFVLGNERHGLMPETLKKCDHIVQIPLFGNKNSLNVGVAAGLSLYEYHRNRQNL